MTVAVAALMPVTAHAQSAETTPPELAGSNTATNAESEASITVVGLRGKPPHTLTGPFQSMCSFAKSFGPRDRPT